MEDNEVGKEIRAIRKYLGLKADQLSKEINMNSTYLTRIENGTIKEPGFETICKIAEAFISSGRINNKDKRLDIIAKFRGRFGRLLSTYLIHHDEEKDALIKLSKYMTTIDEIQDIINKLKKE